MKMHTADPGQGTKNVIAVFSYSKMNLQISGVSGRVDYTIDFRDKSRVVSKGCSNYESKLNVKCRVVKHKQKGHSS